MMYPRGMNNLEKAALKMIKESKLSYESTSHISLFLIPHLA